MSKWSLCLADPIEVSDSPTTDVRLVAYKDAEYYQFLVVRWPQSGQNFGAGPRPAGSLPHVSGLAQAAVDAARGWLAGDQVDKTSDKTKAVFIDGPPVQNAASLAHTNKAGSELAEWSDWTLPKLADQVLMDLLRAESEFREPSEGLRRSLHDSDCTESEGQRLRHYLVSEGLIDADVDPDGHGGFAAFRIRGLTPKGRQRGSRAATRRSDASVEELAKWVVQAIAEAEARDDNLDAAAWSVLAPLSDAKKLAVQKLLSEAKLVETIEQRVADGSFGVFVVTGLRSGGRALARRNQMDEPDQEPTLAIQQPASPAAVAAAQPRKVFLSHASGDKPLADLIVDQLLKLGLELPESRVFYTSRPATGVDSGEAWFGRISSELSGAPLTVAVFSERFKDSAFSHLELGAALIAGDLCVVRAPGTVGYGALGSIQMHDLGDSEAVDAFGAQVAQYLGLTQSAVRWNRHRDQFMTSLTSLSEGALAGGESGQNVSADSLEQQHSAGSSYAAKRDTRLDETIRRFLADPSPPTFWPIAERCADLNIGQVLDLKPADPTAIRVTPVDENELTLRVYQHKTGGSFGRHGEETVVWSSAVPYAQVVADLAEAWAKTGMYPGDEKFSRFDLAVEVGRLFRDHIRAVFVN